MSLCRFGEGKYSMGTVLSLWMSFYTITNPPKFVISKGFTNSQLGVQTID